MNLIHQIHALYQRVVLGFPKLPHRTPQPRSGHRILAVPLLATATRRFLALWSLAEQSKSRLFGFVEAIAPTTPLASCLGAPCLERGRRTARISAGSAWPIRLVLLDVSEKRFRFLESAKACRWRILAQCRSRLVLRVYIFWKRRRRSSSLGVSYSWGQGRRRMGWSGRRNSPRCL